MQLKHLSLTNFRNFARLDVAIPPGMTVLVGGNAQGKTSILEAAYFLAAFASFQTHVDRQLVNFVEARNPLAVARIVGDYERGGSSHRLEIRLVLEPTGANGQRLHKEILLDGGRRPPNEIVGHFNAVVFVPQMSQIVEGGPEERRGYMNMALAQAVPGYAGVLADYGQALAQRNALLKSLGERGGDANQLDIWDETLSGLGARIMAWRIEAVQQIERLAARIHHELSHGREVLRLHYRPAYEPLVVPGGQLGMKLTTEVDRSGITSDDIRQGFLGRLAETHAEEIARGMTVIGPHRDDLRFLANGIDLGDYGSRGQMRTALLALKLAEVSWMKERTGGWPVTLLDEVMAELDVQRRGDLLHYVGAGGQAMLTATDAGMFPDDFIGMAEVWQVVDGSIRR